jgi:hypothetical protein
MAKHFEANGSYSMTTTTRTAVFEDCLIIFRGGQFRLKADIGKGCKFAFQNAALRTVELMEKLHMIPKRPEEMIAIPDHPDPKSLH